MENTANHLIITNQEKRKLEKLLDVRRKGSQPKNPKGSKSKKPIEKVNVELFDPAKESTNVHSEKTSFNRASDVYNNVSKNISSEVFDEEEEDDFGTPKISARRNKGPDTFVEGFKSDETIKKSKKDKK